MTTAHGQSADTPPTARSAGDPADGRTARGTSALSVTGTVLLAIAAIASVTVALGWFRVTPVLSGSMRPLARPGDALLVRRVDAGSLHIGDVIQFTVPARYGGGQKVHRILTLHKTGSGTEVTTKGDANPTADPWRITLSKSAYREVCVIPYVGWVVDFRHFGGPLVLVASASLVWLASQLRRKAKAVSAAQ